jgi:hypothetical protein
MALVITVAGEIDLLTVDRLRDGEMLVIDLTPVHPPP